ncbi:hypothetical protein ACLMJK_006357 [Lecanora helva]
MPSTLLQPHLNITNLLAPYHLHQVPSSFPPPTAPDTYTCDAWYATPHPPTALDCQHAFSLLPSGTEPEPFSYRFHESDPNQLPVEMSYGTCEIVLQASGAAAAQADRIMIKPVDVRNMAGWVLEQCVGAEKQGGAVTKNVKNAVSWVLDPRSRFDSGNMPPSTTFLSLHIWNAGSSEPWNAGDWDPYIGRDIAEYAYKTAVAMAPGKNKDEIERRADRLSDWSSLQRFGKRQIWWGRD